MTTLDPLFGWFLHATLRASLLTLAVLALHALLRNRMPARWRYAMWLPVVLAMAAPWLPRSRWSLEDRATSIAQEFSTYLRPSSRAANAAVPRKPAELEVTDLTANTPVVPPSAAPRTGWDPRGLAVASWLIGALGVSGFMVVAYVRTTRRIRSGARPADETVEAMLAETASACGLAKVPQMVVSSAVESPAVTGFLRPLLLLPVDFPGTFTPAEAALVLRHELTHIQRHDLALNWVLCLLQAIHWCNPLLWLAFARMRADREAACDEAVLAATERDSRAEYGHALLKLESSLAGSGLSLGFVGIFDRAAGLRARVTAIGGYRPAHRGWGLAAVTLMAALSIVGATRAQLAPATKPNGGTQDLPRTAPIASAQNLRPEQKLAATMRAIVIPRLEFREASISDALAFLTKRSVDFDPEKKGVNFVLNLAAPRAPGVSPIPGGAAPADARITVSLTNIPLEEALKYVTSLAGLKYRVGPAAVEVIPLDALDPLAVREWKIDAATQKALGNAPVAALKVSGVSFPPGAAIELSRDGTRLIMKNTEANLRLLDDLLAQRAAAAAAPAGLPGENSGLAAAMQNKLASIVIPRIEFREATLREAIDFLKQKSVQLDPDPDPAKRGVSIVLKLNTSPASPPTSVPSIPGLERVPDPAQGSNPPPESRLTMSLTNIPLGEALKYVANLSDLKLKVEPYAVTLVSLAAESSVLRTKEWRISDAMQSTLGLQNGGDAKAKLIAKGIAFPDGASVTWVPLSNSLVIRNTGENLDKVDELLMPSKPGATPGPAALGGPAR